MSQTEKTLERALEEIERLKSQVSSLQTPKEQQNPKPKWSPNKKSRLDNILKGRKEAMDKLSIKLFGRKNAK